MKKLFDMLRGYVSIIVNCPYPERFLNICAQNGIELWNIKRESEHEVSACVSIKDHKRLKTILDGGNFEMRTGKRSGLPFFLVRFRTRYALIAAMTVTLILVWYSSLFIWEIRISGNDSVSNSEILYCLEKMGIKIGTFRLGLSQEEISNTVLLEIPELSYITVNTNGSIAYVIVRERLPAPEMADREKPVLIYAAKPGIISKLTVMEGKNVLNEGDSVLPGDIVVTGEMESISSEYRYVHAKAEVYARTWYDLSAKGAKEVTEKSYTGNKKTKTALLFGDKRLNLYINGGISYDSYDKIIKEYPVTVFGVLVLPLTVVKETYCEYEPISSLKSADEMKDELGEFLEETLYAGMTGGTVVTTDTETYDGKYDMLMTVRSECVEQIGRERDMTAEEMKP